MSNPDITLCVASFLSELNRERTRTAVHTIRTSAIRAEAQLRHMFAQDRQNPVLSDPYIGLFKAFSIPTELRSIRPRSEEFIERVSVQRSDESLTWRVEVLPAHYLFPLKREMMMGGYFGKPCTVLNLEEFKKNWDIFTHGALKEVSDWNNMVAAGGSVLACLMPAFTETRSSKIDLNDWYQSDAYKGSDIDIFLWGLTPVQAKIKMQQIYLAVKESVPWRVTCVRKSHTITIHTQYPIRPIQIVLRLYLSPAEILAGFDVDCACCLYNGKDVYMNPRALAACILQANTVDTSRRSPSYEVRLAKYSNRGFEIHYPLLNRLRVNYEVLYSYDLPKYPTGLALLIVLEHIFLNPDSYKLYRTRASTSEAPSPPMNFAPISRTMLKSNYDSSWLRIPYGPNWDAKRVNELILKLNRRMNSPHNPNAASRRLHRHLAASGTMDYCLFGLCCPNCPHPTTDAERELILLEKSKYIWGTVLFVEDNPGRQVVGSFNPVDHDEWCAGAYITEAAAPNPWNVRVVSNLHDPEVDDDEGWAMNLWGSLLDPVHSEGTPSLDGDL